MSENILKKLLEDPQTDLTAEEQATLQASPELCDAVQDIREGSEILATAARYSSACLSEKLDPTLKQNVLEQAKEKITPEPAGILSIFSQPVSFRQLSWGSALVAAILLLAFALQPFIGNIGLPAELGFVQNMKGLVKVEEGSNITKLKNKSTVAYHGGATISTYKDNCRAYSRMNDIDWALNGASTITAVSENKIELRKGGVWIFVKPSMDKFYITVKNGEIIAPAGSSFGVSISGNTNDLKIEVCHGDIEFKHPDGFNRIAQGYGFSYNFADKTHQQIARKTEELPSWVDSLLADSDH